MGIQYWWVNHKQTFRQEITGQYLWSPKTESNGARSEFYKNMRRASPGDYVLSYADQQIAFVGRVVEFAFTAPKPEEFGSAGAYWNKEGWLLPVYWVPITPAVRPKDLLEKLRPHLPARYSPINTRTGGGNQKAYLAQISEAMFREIISNTSLDELNLLGGGANSLKFQVVTEILEERVEREIKADPDLESTVKESVILARRGQGKFRSDVVRLERSCRLTGVTNPLLLIASHIKPWRLCTSSQERLDGHNGLMLSPDADYLFDRGLVSFDDNGDPLVSNRIPSADLQLLGLVHLSPGLSDIHGSAAPTLTKDFSSKQLGYLEFHRSEVFISEV